ncbi:DUF2007 domain-containing protein [uncultured Bartonella sp.]|uniref:putative signal transducing protein n=1 Tax=uncultured Bartonella sp. TaxID=104108 RepID=UPI002613E536|nr:DUF2007 domain-containing protein [uncultured Bartonella sp.]
MIELIRTNDIVLLSLVESLMRSAGIMYFTADRNTSLTECLLGVIRCRFLVEAQRQEEARQILIDAGLANELCDG